MRAPARATIKTTRPRNRRQGVESALEGAATEFALLAQRRARISRQLELLRRQNEAAESTLAQVMARMSALSQRIAMLTPEDANPAIPEPRPQAAPARRRGTLLTY